MFALRRDGAAPPGMPGVRVLPRQVVDCPEGGVVAVADSFCGVGSLVKLRRGDEDWSGCDGRRLCAAGGGGGGTLVAR